MPPKIKMEHPCNQCEKIFSTRRDLTLHQYIHKSKPNFSCQICNKVFTTEVQFKRHQNSHSRGKKVLLCPICKQMVLGTKELDEHHRMAHLHNKVFQCDVCKAQFSWKENLVRHMRSHEVNRHTCHECGKGFWDMTSLRLHTRKYHSTTSRAADDVKPHQCPVCGKNFTFDFSLDAHLNSHDRESILAAGKVYQQQQHQLKEQLKRVEQQTKALTDDGVDSASGQEEAVETNENSPLERFEESQPVEKTDSYREVEDQPPVMDYEGQQVQGNVAMEQEVEEDLSEPEPDSPEPYPASDGTPEGSVNMEETEEAPAAAVEDTLEPVQDIAVVQDIKDSSAAGTLVNDSLQEGFADIQDFDPSQITTQQITTMDGQRQIVVEFVNLPVQPLITGPTSEAVVGEPLNVVAAAPVLESDQSDVISQQTAPGPGVEIGGENEVKSEGETISAQTSGEIVEETSQETAEEETEESTMPSEESKQTAMDLYLQMSEHTDATVKSSDGEQVMEDSVVKSDVEEEAQEEEGNANVEEAIDGETAEEQPDPDDVGDTAGDTAEIEAHYVEHYQEHMRNVSQEEQEEASSSVRQPSEQVPDDVDTESLKASIDSESQLKNEGSVSSSQEPTEQIIDWTEEDEGSSMPDITEEMDGETESTEDLPAPQTQGGDYPPALEPIRQPPRRKPKKKRTSDDLMFNLVMTDDKPFQCEFCNQRFRWEISMKVHHQQHMDNTMGEGLRNYYKPRDKHGRAIYNSMGRLKREPGPPVRGRGRGRGSGRNNYGSRIVPKMVASDDEDDEEFGLFQDVPQKSTNPRRMYTQKNSLAPQTDERLKDYAVKEEGKGYTIYSSKRRLTEQMAQSDNDSGSDTKRKTPLPTQTKRSDTDTKFTRIKQKPYTTSDDAIEICYEANVSERTLEPDATQDDVSQGQTAIEQPTRDRSRPKDSEDDSSLYIDEAAMTDERSHPGKQRVKTSKATGLIAEKPIDGNISREVGSQRNLRRPGRIIVATDDDMVVDIQADDVTTDVATQLLQRGSRTSDVSTHDSTEETEESEQILPQKRKRGRPKKHVAGTTEQEPIAKKMKQESGEEMLSTRLRNKSVKSNEGKTQLDSREKSDSFTVSESDIPQRRTRGRPRRDGSGTSHPVNGVVKKEDGVEEEDQPSRGSRRLRSDKIAIEIEPRETRSSRLIQSQEAFDGSAGDEEKGREAESESEKDSDAEDPEEDDEEEITIDLPKTMESHLIWLKHLYSKRGVFICQYCQQLFTDKVSSKLHQLRHTGRRCYSCEECQEKFPYQADLVMHKILHSLMQTHKCQLCAKSYSNQVALEAHIARHISLTSDKCDQCGKLFFQSQALARHQAEYHQASFLCDTCRKSFRDREAYENHQRSGCIFSAFTSGGHLFT